MTQLGVTLFHDRTGSSVDRVKLDWDDLCAQFAAPPVYADKAQAQLFTLCELGDKRTENGSLRSNDNVTGEWGVCGDYDGEVMQPQEAADRLAAAGVKCLVYTSPSHTPEAPRWRVVAPYWDKMTPDNHAANVERLNGVLGGVLSAESFTLSQPFYVGRIAGRESTYWVRQIIGGHIETLTDLPRTPWRGAQRTDGGYRVDTETLLDDLRAGIEIHPAIVALAARGFTQEQLEDVVRRHAPTWERPERGEVAIREDIPRAVGSWERKRVRDMERKLAAAGTPPPYGSTTVAVPRSELFASVSQMTAVYKQTTWLIRDMIDHPSFAILFGEPGAGKSFLSIAWACSVALGRPWEGCRVKQGGVLYLAGEGFNGLSKRFLAWKLHNEISEADWASAPLYVSRRAVDLLDTAAGAEMWDAVAELGITPRLIVIDTLSRMTPGMDENAAKEMSQFVQWCDKVRASFGCTIVIVHHSGVGDKGRSRGSSALKGAADVEMGATKEPGGVLRLFNPKTKEGAEFKPRHFQITDVVLPWVIQPEEPGDMPRQETSAILVPCAGPVESVAEAGRPSKNMDLLRECVIGEMIIDDAREAFCRVHEGANRKVQVRAFNRAVRAARDAGLIIWDEDNGTVRLFDFGGGQKGT